MKKERGSVKRRLVKAYIRKIGASATPNPIGINKNKEEAGVKPTKAWIAVRGSVTFVKILLNTR